jgi:hypothetical protein
LIEVAMLSCREVTRRISTEDGTPTGIRARMQIRLHLLMCRSCQRYQRQLRAIATAARAISRQSEPDAEAVDRAAARVLAAAEKWNSPGSDGRDGSP